MVVGEKAAVADIARIAFVDCQRELLSLSNISDFNSFTKAIDETPREPFAN